MDNCHIFGNFPYLNPFLIRILLFRGLYIKKGAKKAPFVLFYTGLEPEFTFYLLYPCGNALICFVGFVILIDNKS